MGCSLLFSSSEPDGGGGPNDDGQSVDADTAWGGQATEVHLFTRAATGDDWPSQTINVPKSQSVRSLALNANGSRLVVGAEEANVFRLDENWTMESSLQASNADPEDRFGWSVSMDAAGDTIAIGAPYEDGNASSSTATPNDGAFHAGAAYIFEGVP